MTDEFQLDAALFDTVASLIVVLDRAGRIVRFNRACERLTGRSRAQVVGTCLWDFALPPEEIERVKDLFAHLDAEGVPAEYANEWLTPNGRRRITWSSTVLRDERGNVRFVVATGCDVTEQSEAEQRLRRSEWRFRTMVEAAQEGIWRIDEQDRTTYVNRRMEQMLGYDPGEMLGRSVYDFFQAGEKQRVAENLQRRRRGIREQYEFRLQRKDGSEVPVLASSTPLLDERGVYTGALAMVADVTELKAAQCAARDAERRLEFALSAANMLAWEWEPGTGRRFHRGSADLLGTPQCPEEFFRVIHPEDAPAIRKMVEQLLARPGSFAAEYRVRGPDGKVRWVRDRGVVEVGADGTPARMAGITFDVTDRREAEQTLRESEERFRLVVHNSPDLMFYQDRDLRFTWFSKAIPPFTPENMLGLRDDDVLPPDQLEAHRQAKLRVIGSGVGERIGTAMEIGGRMYYFDTALEPRRNAEGQIIGLAGYTRNVTRQRLAELELQRLNATLEQRVAERAAELEGQKRLLELVLQNMGDGVAVVDQQGRFVLFNAAAERILGRPLDNVPQHQWSAYFGFFLADGTTPRPAESLPMVRALHGEPVDDAEMFIRNPGQPAGAWASATARPVLDARGERVGAVSVLRDLTERKSDEQALRLSETRLRLLVAQSPISIQTFAPDGTVRSANRAWERLFGVTVEQIAGYNVLEDPQLAEQGIQPLIRRAFAGETVAIPPIPYIPPFGRRAGVTTWTRAHMYPVIDPGGQIREIVLMHEDIGEQKRIEDELRERERHYRAMSEHNRRLVREVEHRVRNNLAALLGLIAMTREQASDVASFADAMEQRIGGIAHVHQMLATGGWQPMGLRALIESMLGAMAPVAPRVIEQVIDGPDVVVSPRRVLPLAMILVEWFTNSCKYGAHRSERGRVTIGWSVLPGRRVRLAWQERGGPPVEDSGKRSVGSELVNAFATGELEGHCASRFDAEGVSHVLEFRTDGEPE